MRKPVNLLFFLIIILLTGCQKDGYIGRLYGTWRLNDYYVNGEKISELSLGGKEIPASNVTFSFQSDIINIMAVVDNYATYYSQFGTYTEEGDVFTLNFTHYDDNNPVGTDIYAAPKWLGMISDAPMIMKSSENSSRSFTLTWTDPDGNVRVYKLHKTW